MKVSIVTIAYNSADTIEDTIASVLDQDYGNIEYIIVDGASTDNTVEIARKYEDRIAHIISEPDKGLYDAMNKGIKSATGDIVGILNSDDLYAHNGVVSAVVKKLIETKAQGLYADLKYVDREDLTKVKRSWVSGIYKRDAFKRGWMPPHPTFFVQRILYTQLGLYNLSFKTSADYELMLRFIHKHRIKVAYLNDFIILMRVGGQSNVSLANRLAANKEDRRAWHINGLQMGFFTPVMKPLSKVGQFLKK